MSGKTWGTAIPTDPISGEPRNRPVSLKELANEGGWEIKGRYDGWEFSKDGRKLFVRYDESLKWALSAFIYESPFHGGMKIEAADAKRVLFGERCICDSFEKSGLETTPNPDCPFTHLPDAFGWSA